MELRSVCAGANMHEDVRVKTAAGFLSENACNSVNVKTSLHFHAKVAL